MKQLFWKEWHELRLLPLGAVLLFAPLSLGYLMACRRHLAGLHPEDFSLAGYLIALLLVWLIFAILAGSGLISQEVGSGTLTFLLALPRSRRQIWLVKAATGFGAFVFCALCSSFACFVLWGFTVQWAQPQHIAAWMVEDFLAFALLVATGCYSVSLAISPLLDRYMSAALVSIVACIVIAYTIIAANTGPTLSYLPDPIERLDLSARLEYVCEWLAIPAMLAISYWTFTRGESLRTAKRFTVAGEAAIVAFVVFLALFLSIRAYIVAYTLPGGTISPNTLAIPQGSSISFPWYDVKAKETFWIPWPSHTSAAEELLVDGKVVWSGPMALDTEPSMATSLVVVRVTNPVLRKLADPFTAPVDTPPNARLAVSLIDVDHNSQAIPLTLKFVNGAGAIDYAGSPANAGTPVQSKDTPVILDLLFMDRSLKRAPRDWVLEPDDPTFPSHYAPDTVHRITVRIRFTARPG